jgi:predicted nucleic acid-binding protein
MPRNPVVRPKPVFVLDVSVAVPWILRRLWSDYTSRVLNSLIRSHPLVPASWWADLLAASLDAEIGGLIEPAEVTAHLESVVGLPIHVDTLRVDRHRTTALNLARELALPILQAAALELALRTQLPLATIDTRLRTAATSAGVALFTP